MAGFIDGEGTVSISHHNRPGRCGPTYEAYVSVEQVEPAPLRFLQRLWGGSLGLFDRRVSLRHRPRWVWRVSGEKAVTLLKEVRPYLLVKGPVADVVIKYWDTTRHTCTGYRVSPEEWVRRATFVAQVRQLNKRGVCAA